MSYIEDIQDLLDRAERYRTKNYEMLKHEEPINKEEYFEPDYELNFKDDGKVIEVITSGDIREKYVITKEEARNGCIKNLEYTKLNRFHKEIETNINFEVPKDTRNGQNIILEGEGNYMKDRYSDLIIKIIIR